jgi:hypothetical protein
MRRPLRQLVHRIARSSAVAVTLIGFLTAQIGFPIMVRPASASATTTGGQVRPCGCLVADESQSCCCGPTKAPAAKSCCQSHETTKPAIASCCQTHDAAPNSGEAGASRSAQTDTERDSTTHVEWVIGSLLQHCHGVQTCWIALGAVLPFTDDAPVSVTPLLPEWVPSTEATAFLRSAPPNDPPPRIPSI